MTPNVALMTIVRDWMVTCSGRSPSSSRRGPPIAPERPQPPQSEEGGSERRSGHAWWQPIVSAMPTGSMG